MLFHDLRPIHPLFGMNGTGGADDACLKLGVQREQSGGLDVPTGAGNFFGNNDMTAVIVLSGGCQLS